MRRRPAAVLLGPRAEEESRGSHQLTTEVLKPLSKQPGTDPTLRIGTRPYGSVDRREDLRDFRVMDGELPQAMEVSSEPIVISESERQM